MSASRNGYIGRAPADSSVIVARKTFEPTGVQTDFTFTAGYTPGYCDVYLNGVRLIDEKDFTASNGSTVGLTSASQSGDVLEIVAYKAFNLGAPISDVTGNLDVTGNISASSSITAVSLFGDGTGITNIAGTGITQYIAADSLTVTGNPGVSTFTRLETSDAVVTGIITANGFSGNVTGAAITVTGAATFNSNVTIGGTLTYEDVTNVDALGIITARSGVNISGGQLQVGVAYSVGTAGVATALGLVAGSSGLTISGSTSGTTGDFSSNLTVGSGITMGSAGVLTATSVNVRDQIGGFNSLVGTASSTTKTYAVTVDSKTSNHRYKALGSALGYYIDGVESPFITLLPGKTYKFDQSDNSNSNHPLRFYLDPARVTIYETNITTSGTAGNAGAATTISVVEETPSVLYYQCTQHGYMGNAVGNDSNQITTPYEVRVGAAFSVGSAGVVTATKFVGDGSELTGISGAVAGTTGSFSSNLTVGSGITFGSAGVATFSGTSDVHLTNAVELQLGDSKDLKLYHNASGNNWMYSSTSAQDLYIGANAGEIYFQTGASANDTAIKIVSDSFVELRYDNNWKLQTTNDGIYVNGIGTASRSYVNTPSVREDDNIPLLVKGIVREDPVIGIQGKSSNGVTLIGDAYVDGESQFTLGLHYSGCALVLGQVGVSTDTNNAYVSIQDAYAHRPGAMVIDDGAIKFRNDSADGIRPVGTAVTMYNRMIIENNGRVLIGDSDTYAASGDLHVVGDTNSNGPELYLQVNNNNTTDNIGALYWGNNADKTLNRIAGHTKLANNTSYLTFSTSKAGTLATKLELNNDGAIITGITTFSNGGVDFNGILREKHNQVDAKLSADANIDLDNGMLHYYSVNETTTATPNIRYNSSKSLNNSMTIGETVTVTIIYKPNGAGYYAALNVDGSGVTEEWNGGSAPSAAEAGGYDVLTHTLVKTADASFLCFSNNSNFA